MGITKLNDNIKQILELLNYEYDLKCDISFEEFMNYIRGETYEEEIIKEEEILKSEFFLLHEIAEICILKKWGYDISINTIKKAYPDTYRAHLTAMDIELREAKKKRNEKHIQKRCIDLKNYFEDPYLPKELTSVVEEIMKNYCVVS